MKIITPEKVIQAYKETGLKPINGDFFNKNYTCACPLSALYAHSKNKENPQQSLVELSQKSGLLENIRKELGIEKDFDLEKFYHGVDNLQHIGSNDTDEFHLGNYIRLSLNEKFELNLN